MHLPKICSLRSQIFRFLHASSVSVFARFARDKFALLAISSLRSLFCVCVFAHFGRDMFGKSVRFAHRFSVFYMHLLSLLSLAICSENLFASLTDFPFSTCIFCLCFRSLRSRYVRKICSLRSQIFRFLYASSVSALPISFLFQNDVHPFFFLSSGSDVC